MAENTRLSGHELRWEGAPHDGRGLRIHLGYYAGVSGEGRGKCSCGALSPVLPSATQRKVWHREHKSQMRAEADRG